MEPHKKNMKEQKKKESKGDIVILEISTPFNRTWKPRPKGSFDEGLKENTLDLSMGRSQE
ncbi:hypothetical protein [Neobacillus drentensis]|uniref:hypothetical protein n=1 Tax=Neobacillus drentensis TaxID=220684 RepID=UPI00300048F5